MSDFEGNIRAVTSYCDVPLSPSPMTILSMLNYTDNNQNIMSDIFSQSNTQKHQSKQRYGSFGERLGSRIEFQLPPLDKENISPFAAFFRADPIVPSPPISPGFNPSTFLQSPNMLSDSSQISLFPVSDNRPPEMIEGFNEGHAAKMVSNNEVTHQQPMHVYAPPQEGSDDIVAEVSVNILSHESHVEPIGASSESEIDVNINSMQNESKDDEDEKDENHDIVNTDVEENKNEDREIIDVDEYEEKHRDQYIIDFHALDDSETSSKKRRLHDQGSQFGAIRKRTQQRVIIQMETEEDNPDDGFRWRKYGHKVIKGTLMPRNYYRCTYDGCDVKKHVERETNNKKLLVTTYDGIHEHHVPNPRIFGPRNQNRASENTIDQAGHRLKKRPSTSSPSKDTRPHFTFKGPQTDMAQLLTIRPSKLSSLPVHHNTSFIHQNDQLANQNPGFMHQNDNFMHLSKQYLDPNLSFINQNYQLVNHDSSLMSKNDQSVNQRDSSFTCWNDQSDNQDPSFMFWNSQPIDRNPGFASQKCHSVNPNPGEFNHKYHLVNKNLSFTAD